MYKGQYRWMMNLGLLVCLVVFQFNTLYAQKATHEDSLINAVSVAKSDTQKVKALLRLCHFYKPDIVIKEFYYANEALILSEKMGWEEGKMYAEELIGESYITVIAYKDAIIHFKRSIIASRKIKRMDMEKVCLQYMVHCYHKSDDLPTATNIQKILLDINARSGDQLGESNQRNTYAQLLGYAGRYSDAISYMRYNMALAKKRFKGTQQINLVADMLNTLATIYIEASRTDSALICLRKADMLAQQTGDTFLRAYIMSSFCDVYTATGQYDSAILYGERGVKMGRYINDIVLQQQYYKVLSHVYEIKHLPQAALISYRMYDSLTAIIDATQKTIDQAMAVTKINMEQQAEQNIIEKRAMETVRHNQRTALIAVLIAMLALAILTIFIYRNLRQKLLANKIIGRQAASLQQQNKIIDNALKEKEILLQETHHRVKNNLQLISSLLELQMADVEDEHAKNALRTAQRRVQSIATVHNKLYNNGENGEIEFSAFVNDLFVSLYSAFSSNSRRVKFDNAIPPTFFGLTTLVPLGLILNELITNSFKHAFVDAKEGLITIQLQLTGEEYMLRYYDNGPGMQEGEFDNGSGSLGLHLVKRLSKQLKGKATYNFNTGSIFTISFHDAAN